MTFKPAYIQEPTPAQRGSRAGHFASDLSALGLHSSQHGFDGGRDGDTEGLASSALGAGEGKHTVFQVHALQRDLRLSQTAAGGQGDLKANFHPFGHTFHGQSLPGDFNLIIRKDGFNAGNRAPFNLVIQKGDRVHLSEQSALAVNPFKNLQILAGLVASRLTAGRARKALAPFQINFTIGWRKRLQGYFFFDNKSHKMTPAVSVIHFCEWANGVIFDQIINPFAPAIFSLFVHAKSGGLGRCLRAVEGIIDSVAGAFSTPLARGIFETNIKPRIAFFNVRIGHSYKGNIWAV